MYNNRTQSKYRYSLVDIFLILVILFLFFFINQAWSKYNFSFDYWGMAEGNFSSVFQLYADFKEGITFTQLLNIMSIGHGHGLVFPPLYFVYQTGVSYIIGSCSYSSVVLANSLLFLLAAIFIYKIATILNDKKAGLIAVLILSVYPGIYCISRFCMIENAITPIVAISIYFLIKSRNFLYTRYCSLFGLSLGLGLLTKQHFLIFVIGGVYYEIHLLFVQKKNKVGKNYKKYFNLIIILMLLMPSIFYYVRNYNYQVLNYGLINYGNLNQNQGTNIKPGTLASWLFYLFALINYQTSLPLFIIFFIAFIWLIISTKKNKSYLHLILWILLPYFIFQIFEIKCARYTINYLPSCALISGLFISQLKIKRFWISFLVIIICIFGLIQNICFSFFDIQQKPLITTDFFKNVGHLEIDGNIYPFSHNRDIRKPDYIKKIHF